GSVVVEERASRRLCDVEPTSGVVSYPAATRQAATPVRGETLFFDHSSHRLRSESPCAAPWSLSGVALGVVLQPVRITRAVAATPAFVIGSGGSACRSSARAAGGSPSSARIPPWPGR